MQHQPPTGKQPVQQQEQRSLRKSKALRRLGAIATLSSFSGAALALLLTMAPLKSSHAASHLPNSPASLSSVLPATLARPVNILVLGIDNSGHPHSEHFTPSEGLAGNSDTMLLIRLKPDTHEMSILSIPRDTLVETPDGPAKINAANFRGGVRLAAHSVSHLLDDIPIDRYIRVDTEGFIQWVDALGGVEINVPKPMDYVDHTQNLNIHFAPGLQKLSGQHLQEYVRFRHDDLGDIGRVQRQQEAMKAIVSAFLRPATLGRLPKLLQVVQRNVDTDLSVGEMLAIAQFLARTNQEQTNFVMLPGRFSTYDEYPLSYWIPDSEAAAPVLARYFDLPAGGTQAIAPDLHQVRIAVANATGQTGLAAKTVALLQNQGFYNAFISDQQIDLAATPRSQTQVIAQRGNPDTANVVKSTLGVGQVQVESTGDLESDITVRVGTDFAAKLNP